MGANGFSKKKTDIGGKVVSYKAKLGVKGYQQSQCVDYDETYSPVAMIKSIHIFLAIVTHYENEFWQMDVKVNFP